MIGFMFTSLNVVSIAVSFFTATSRLEMVFLRLDIFLRSCSLPPGTEIGAASAALGADFSAAIASSLVIRPSLPVPVTPAESTPFSERILAAAGDAWPVA